MPHTRPSPRWGALAVLVLAVVASYANALWGDFQFDDYKVIVDNPAVHAWDAWRIQASQGIRPLLKLTYTLNWVSGWGAPGFLATNLLIHLCNVGLVYRLAQAFVRAQALPERMSHVPLLTALLFAVHPIHTEAVTYICGRSTSLMAMLYLAALLAYALGRERHNRFQLWVLTPLLFIGSLSVKETAVTFPFALWVWELTCGGTWRTALKNQWPTWLAFGAGAAFFLFSESYLGHMQRSVELNSLRGNAATQLLALGYLMGQWALPLQLNIDPDLPLLHDFSGVAPELLCILLAAVLAWGCWRLRPWISFALVWGVLQLVALYLFLPRLDVANDRQMYLADWPLFLALAVEISLWTSKPLFRGAAVAVVLALGGLTVVRNQDYASEIALWQDTSKKSPHKARVHNNLGYAYKLANRTDDARREFMMALQMDPHHIKARYNLDRLNSPWGSRP